MQRNQCVSKRQFVVRMAMLLAMALGVTGFTGRAPAAENPSGQQVTIDNFSFTPATLTVPVGTEVTWVNHDDIPHTVASDDKSFFKARALDTDEKFSFTFSKAGTYSYFCSIHPKMTAKVVVQ
jgi:plastocyanin